MKQILCALVIVLFSSVTSFGQNPIQTGQIILKFKNVDPAFITSNYDQRNTGNVKVDAVSQKFNVVKIKKQSTGRKNKQHIYVISFPQGTNVQQVIEEYYKTGEIEYAEPDYIISGGGTQGVTPNDPNYNNQWGLKNDGTFVLSPAVPGADIDMENAWAVEQGDSNIVVGIIDSGAKLNHPEFSGRIWTNYNEIPNNGIDDDN